jgi:preprotein translocase subunit SecE
MANRITSYFRESRDELKKVIWPNRQQTTNDTLLVISISVFVAFFLGIMDIVLNWGLQKILLR